MKRLSERQIFERSITEEDVFGACRQLLELNGARVHRVVERIPWGKKKSEPGIPDTFGWFKPFSHPYLEGSSRPIHFFIEFKRPHKAERRPAQIAWIDSARRDGAIAFFADSVEAMVIGFKEFGIKIEGLQ